MPPRRPDGPPPPPPVARVRLRFAKRGRLRFLSQLDLARSFERGLRRARVPIAFSAGFSPHPKVSWVGGVPTGAASEAEYVELALAEDVDPEALRVALDAALPPGFDLLACVPAEGGPLAGRIEASRWSVRVPGVPAEDVSRALDALLARESLEVERRTKSGRALVDVRRAVICGVCRASAHDCAILDVVVRHTTPAVRPDDVLTALGVVAVPPLTFPVPPEPTRLEQGLIRVDGTLADPLAAPSGAPNRSETDRLAGRLTA
ncbi:MULTISPECIES: TIGR03936 family radical SAM-associated protein [unclassified Pseudofrankia]|uniref:TIGR03936 family radical SAM-associated protein n=1 Tax=unclassified Pseudofrankia TaxID=2994372 RepID=UPI0008DA7504|nr:MULTISPECIES: TIGR03936 family radical SAM-associated protein [unclassified Pseudofrankia]MDT3445378.1 TIGR03936 family radical SAM-associated protein [Pseudofrankia sp. BMG5.37]OHV59859.1 radical SAM protein [Pseudofrankia sp. BMG5.36]